MAKSELHASPLSQRRFLLKYGGNTLGKKCVEVRDGHFELLGNCDAEDLHAIAALVGLAPSSHLSSTIAQLPHGIITPFAL